MQTLQITDVIKSLKSSYGRDFLDTITMQLHKAIGAQHTFIAKVDTVNNVSQTISIVSGQTFGDNFEYALDHTPCANVNDDNTCIYPANICRLFPDDELLVAMGIEGYVGAPLHNSVGEVFGIVVALYTAPIEDADDVAALFELFSGRIAAEIERWQQDNALKELNDTLERKVSERTRELQQTIVRLEASQAKLVEQEKLASLGRLVAGVAHEVNTPLGVAILGNSTASGCVQQLEEASSGGKLTKSRFEAAITDIKAANDAVANNLKRASELVGNFKQMAVEFHTDQLTDINLTEWVLSITNSLQPMFCEADIHLDVKLPECPVLTSTYPSRLAQVLTSILSNALIHAFPASHRPLKKTVSLVLNKSGAGHCICIDDNGVGMSKENIKRVFEPFFTTRRGAGDMGLGMSITHNLVTQSLGGDISITSGPGEGTRVTLHFKT